MSLLLSGCGYNNIPTYEEQAKAKWSDVLNQYQRRSDLIPNLVETVKGYAQQEKSVLEAVTAARAQATSIKVDASTITDPTTFKRFQDAQAQLSGSARPAAGDPGKLPRPEVQPEFSGPAIAAGRHREPHRGGAARLHRGSARVQHRTAHVSPAACMPGSSIPANKPMEEFTVADSVTKAPQVKF